MKTIVNLVLVATLFFASTAFAKQTTEERLKALENQIEKLQKENESLPDMGYDRGFFIRTKDKKNMFKVRFFTQIYYEYDAINGSSDVNTFGIRRARLLLSGNVFTPKLTYMIMPEMVANYTTSTRTTATGYTVVDTGGNVSQFTVTDIDTDDDKTGFRLLYLWGQYKFAESFNLRFGEFKPQMHRQYTTGSNVQQFPNFPMTTITEPFVPGFQTGLDLFGSAYRKKFHYSVFAVNGSGFDRINLNKSMRVGTRLVYDILSENVQYTDGDLAYSVEPKLSIGGHFSYEKADETSVGNYVPGNDMMRASMDALFKYKGFSFDPEGYYFHNWDQGLNHWGMTVQTGYFIIPKKLDISAQASIIWFDGDENDRYEFGGGMDYYFFGHPVKLQADYGYIWYRQAGPDLKDNRIRLSMEIGFF